MEPNILAIRALNHWKLYYQPTYVGIRLLIEQLPSFPEPYIKGFLFEKIANKNSGSYQEFLRFKGMSSQGRPDFRRMDAASPIMALGEAFALQIICRESILGNRPNVYSYRWPDKERSGRDYTYFYSGYADRNNLITRLATSNPSFKITVCDIRSFYPSVDVKKIIPGVEKYLDSIKDKRNKELVRSSCFKLLNTGEKGIPIGPALGHIFGNIALSSIDANMSKLLGERYTRYVDDIILITENDKQADNAKKNLEMLLDDESLEINVKKTDRLSSEEWLSNLASPEERQLDDNFNDIIDRIRNYLWWKPSKKDALRGLFVDQGIPMPIKRMWLDASYGRFHHFMRNLFWNNKRRFRRVRLVLEQETDAKIFDSVYKLSESYLKLADRWSYTKLTDRPQINKMRIQRCKRMLNRLLYLIPTSRYSDILSVIPDADEFIEQRNLIQAVMTRSVNPILQNPGPVVSAFASFCRELEWNKLDYNKDNLMLDGVFDSMSTLITHDVVEVPESWLAQLPASKQQLIRFCLCSNPLEKVPHDFGFADEINTLQLGTERSHILDILDTRFDDAENIDLDALLMSDYS